MRLPRARPKEQGSGKRGGNHCEGRAKEGSEDTRKIQGEEQSEKLQGLEGTQGAPRKAVAEEAGRVRESGDKLKTGHHLVLQSKEVNLQSGGIPAAASTPTLQGN